MEPCSLCQLVNDDRRGRVYEDERLVVLLETGGKDARVLVVPRQHRTSLEALGRAAESHMFKISERAGASLGAAGMQLATRGFEVVDAPHVHLSRRLNAR